MFYDRGNHYEFLSLVQELASPGEMRAAQNFEFEFKNVEKQYESYNGINVKLRYVRLLSPVPLMHGVSRVTMLMKTIFVVFACVSQKVLYSGHDIKTLDRCGQGTRYLGPLVSHATRLEQRHQDGSRYRGLFAHRV